MGSLTTNKRERLDREGWEALGALRELPELSRPEEPVSTVVSGPLHFHRATAPLWGFGLPARSPQRLFGYVVLSLLPPNKGSKQDQQGASTALRRPCHELLLPPLVPPPAPARMLGPKRLLAQDYPAPGACTGVASTWGHFGSNKPERVWAEMLDRHGALWGLQKFSGIGGARRSH